MNSALRTWLPGLILLLSASLALSNAADELPTKTGTIVNHEDACAGFTLLFPIGSTTTYLIDMEGRVANRWESAYRPGQSAYLLENGHLLRTISPDVAAKRTFRGGGGAGGGVQEFAWDGELLWEFIHASDEYLQHHDVAPLPNGNVLMLAWEKKSVHDAIRAGRAPETLGPEGLWSEKIIEVEPTGKETGKIVWEWHAWDHLVQEADPDEANHGILAEHPELITINPYDWTKNLSPAEQAKLQALGYLGSSQPPDRRRSNPDFLHINAIAHNAELDQIMLSVLGFNEIWVLDHSTTTEEAAGHAGGKQSRGGDLLYRWGNPQAYGMGSAKDQQLFAQHDAHWIPTGLPGAGRILLFNNGRGRRGEDHSSVDVIVPPVTPDGSYERDDGQPFGPERCSWSYTAPNKSEFYSIHISGAQRLPNGNTLICSGEMGTIFEVTPDKRVVWKYINPILNRMPRPGMDGGSPDRRGERPPREAERRRHPQPRWAPGMGGGRDGRPPMDPKNCVFRAYRYTPDYSGLAGKELPPGPAVEELMRASIKKQR